MIIAYLIIACFASALATDGFSENYLVATIWGLCWPAMIVIYLFMLFVSR